jgi:hypothetical protein
VGNFSGTVRWEILINSGMENFQELEGEKFSGFPGAVERGISGVVGRAIFQCCMVGIFRI